MRPAYNIPDYNEYNFCKSVERCTSTSINELSRLVKTNSNETSEISAELSAQIKITSSSAQESIHNKEKISYLLGTIGKLDDTLTSLRKNDKHLDQKLKDAISTLDNLRGTVTNMTSSINERKYQNTLSSYSLIIGPLACMLLIFAYLLKRNKAGNINTQNETNNAKANKLN